MLNNIILNDIYLIDYMDGLKILKSNSVDLVLTDPPYKIGTQGGGFTKEKEYLHTGLKNIGVSKDTDIYTDEFFSELERVCRNINFFFFCNKLQIFDILKYCDAKGYNFDIIVLLKTNPLPAANNQWLPDKEFGIHIYKNLKVMGNYQTKKSYFISSNFKDTNIPHPTPKPLKLIEKILMNISMPEDIVLDPFMGSGTTAHACINLKRKFIGFEINEKYYNYSKKRIKEAKGECGLFEIGGKK